MADRIIVMQGGIAEQSGAPLELYDRPSNVFVAGFIGSPAMNIFQGRIGRSPEGFVFEGDIGVLPLASDIDVSEGQIVLYGIRPEHIRLTEDGMPARVSVVEPTGAETQVYLKVGNGDLVAVFRERHELQPGQEIRLKPDSSRAHLFDAVTGNRL